MKLALTTMTVVAMALLLAACPAPTKTPTSPVGVWNVAMTLNDGLTYYSVLTVSADGTAAEYIPAEGTTSYYYWYYNSPSVFFWTDTQAYWGETDLGMAYFEYITQWDLTEQSDGSLNGWVTGDLTVDGEYIGPFTLGTITATRLSAQ